MRFRILFLFLTILACTKKATVSDTILNYLPQNAAVILKINTLENFKSELKNGTFFSKTKNTRLSKTAHEKLNSIHFLKPSAKCVIGFYELGKEKIEFLFVADNNPDFFDIEKIDNQAIEKSIYEGHEIATYTIENTTLFVIEIDDKVVASSSRILLENFLRTKKDIVVPEKLQKLFDTTGDTKSASIFINLKNSNGLFSSYLKNDSKKSINNLADWVSVDFTTDSNITTLNGIAISNDSINNFVNLFKGTTPIAERVSSIAPQNTEALIAYSFNSYEVFSKNQEKYLDKLQKKDSLFNTIEEVGIFYLNKQKAVSLSSFGADNLINSLDKLSSNSSSYQGVEIKTLNSKDLISKSFDPLVKDFTSNFYIVLENTFIFASNKEILQNVIANTKSATTFNKTALYNSAKSNLANESSALFIANQKGIANFLELDFSSELFNDFKKVEFKDHAFAAQLVADANFYHVNIIAAKAQKEIKANAVGPLFTVELDTDIATNPQFVKNHRNNTYEIITQDKNNVLYLISASGKVIWKKQLNGKVRGRIEQVDLYKNGKLQLAFCTNNQFLIIDRNGKEVKPFNKKFDSGNLNPLAVFDYENNKDYRFLVTQGRKVFMYNTKGEIVEGFSYKEADKPIIKSPKHFKISKKDYLVFLLEDNTVAIRHRAGQERLKVNRKIDFSDNEIFLYKNKFSITDKKGVLHQIDTKGKLSATNFNLGKEHGMFATSKTLALMNENILSIKGKKVELDLGIYTAPKIFYINDKIYVSVTDIQNQKIYLFDSQAKSIANFPVYGNSIIDLVDMDGDRKLELVAKDQENSLITYKIH